MTRADTTTTHAAVPVSSMWTAAIWADPAKMAVVLNRPSAWVRDDAPMAEPMAKANGTTPTTIGVMSRMPSRAMRRCDLRVPGGSSNVGNFMVHLAWSWNGCSRP